MLADWESQSEDEETWVSSPGADRNVSSLHNEMLIVGEEDDSDLDSPPQSLTSQSDNGMGEVSSGSADDENSDDPNARAKDSVTCKSTSQSHTGLY